MKATMRIWFVATVLAVLVAAPCMGSEYAAMIMDLKNGTATYAEGPMNGKPVQVMEFLYESDSLKVSAGATLVLNYFDSGHREEIQGPVVIRIAGTHSEPVGGSAAGIKKEKIAYLPPKSDIDNMYAQNFGNVSFRGFGKKDKETDRLEVLTLQDTSIRPGIPATLEWNRVTGADGYRATLIGRDGSVLKEVRTAGTRAAFPEEWLKARRQYAWRLEALRGDAVAKSVEGRFAVLSSARAQAVTSAQNSIEARFPSDSTEALSALNLLYQGHNLRDEAAGVLMTLHERFPQNEMVKNQIRSLNPALLPR